MDWAIRLGIDAETKSLKQIVRHKYVSKEMENEHDENINEHHIGSIKEDDKLFGSTIVGNEDIVQQIDDENNKYVLCDWWGTSKHLIPRNKEKMLITITFARPT